jgi:hypothetical protein
VKPVAPAFLGYAGKVHLATDDLERLTVKKELAFTNFKSVRLGKGWRCQYDSTDRQKEKNMFHKI